jgi:fimbrial chaperone protein
MRTCLVPVAIVALLLAPQAAVASNFTVTPTEVNLSASATSALVTVRNRGKVPLRFEITLVSWSEDEHGQMTLNPSADVTFFPKLVELPAGASRNIRIGINAGTARDVERSFRLFVEELPDQSAPAANAVALRTKIGIPVFVRPAKPSRTAGDRWRLGRERQRCWRVFATPATCTSASIPSQSRHWWIGPPPRSRRKDRLVRAAGRDANL